MDKFKIVVKTLKGLEEILATEIETLGGINITIGTRMVSFIGDKALLYKANLRLRTALRVLKPFATFQANDPDDLYEHIKQIDWKQYIAPGQTLAIDATVNGEAFRHSKFALYRAKDAICDFFTEQGDKRPTISVTGADILINLHINENECTLSLDSSGEPLQKRGYKVQQTDAPISEVLAAGILLKAGWDGSKDLCDPMCGSGTFLIEAALIATNTPAGICRTDFGFEHWKVGALAFDEELWHEIYNDDSQEREFTHRIYGFDISKPAIDAATANIKAAGMSKYISLEVKDFENTENAPSPGCIMVCNPPYGKRLFTDVPTFYKMMGSILKRAYQGCEAWIIATEEEPFNHIGLKPSEKFLLNNGGLDCELRKYEMFKGRFDDFRAEGKALNKSNTEKSDHFTRIHSESKPNKGRRERGNASRKEGDEEKRRSSGRDKNFSGKGQKSFDKEHKPFDRSKKSFDKERKPMDKNSSEARPRYERGNFRRNSQGELEERPGTYKARGERKYDPNRPMFHKDFDLKQNILDFSDHGEGKE